MKILKVMAITVCLSSVVCCANCNMETSSCDDGYYQVDGRVVHVRGDVGNVVDGGIYVGNCFIPSSELSFEFDNVLIVVDGEVYLDYLSFSRTKVN